MECEKSSSDENTTKNHRDILKGSDQTTQPEINPETALSNETNKQLLYKKYNIVVEEDINNNKKFDDTELDNDKNDDVVVEKEITNNDTKETDEKDQSVQGLKDKHNSQTILAATTESKFDYTDENVTITDLFREEWLTLEEFDDIIIEEIEKFVIEKRQCTPSSSIESKGCTENDDNKSNSDSKTDVISISSDEEINPELKTALGNIDDEDILSSMTTLCDSKIEINIVTDSRDCNNNNGNEYAEKFQINKCENTELKTKERDENFPIKDKDSKDITIETIIVADDTNNDVIETISLHSNSSDNTDDFCNGYNSSDFEFITEEEAKQPCSFDDASGSTSSRQDIISRKIESPNIIVEHNHAHNIPEGDQYLNLFEGGYEPSVPYMYEEKSMGFLLDMHYDGLGFDIRALQQVEDDDEYKQDAEESRKKILNMYPHENKKRRRRF